MHYNTNNETGETLAKSNKKATTQEEQIFQMFRFHRKLSASQAWNLYPCKKTPLTSIRRAITNLCKVDKLEKTATMTSGVFGKKEHVYKVQKTA